MKYMNMLMLEPKQIFIADIVTFDYLHSKSILLKDQCTNTFIYSLEESTKMECCVLPNISGLTPTFISCLAFQKIFI